LCAELQRVAGRGGPFFLDARTAGRLLGVHYTTVARWLRGLCRDDVLRLETHGGFKTHKASRYRYLAPLHDGPAGSAANAKEGLDPAGGNVIIRTP
ncbi:MAG TPA: hypothetical protein VGX76_11390, partial [Pirellulales bacterium]|nr:hypothetical protein [Pirellulales bacterium]